MKVLKELLPQPYKLTIIEDDLAKIKKEKEKIFRDFKSNKENKKFLQKHFSGFRPDSIPRTLADNKLNQKDLYQRFLDDLLKQGIEKIDLDVNTVITADVEDMLEGYPITIVAVIDVSPSVELGEYKGMEIEYEPIEVSDEEIEAVLQRMRESQGKEVSVTDREIQEGDIAYIQFDGEVDGKPFEGGSTKKPDGTYAVYPLRVGSGQFIPGFEDQVIGMKVGETRKVKTIFPQHYVKEELQDKEGIFTVELKSLAIKELPELNDDFAKGLGYNNIIDARDKLKDDLLNNKSDQNEMLVDDNVLNKLLDVCKVGPISQTLLDKQLEQKFQSTLKQSGLDEASFVEKTRTTKGAYLRRMQDPIVREIQGRFLLESIANKENIELTDEQLDKELKAHADKRKITLEELKKQTGLADLIRDRLRLKKTLDFIKDNAKIKTVVTSTTLKPTVTEANL